MKVHTDTTVEKTLDDDDGDGNAVDDIIVLDSSVVSNDDDNDAGICTFGSLNFRLIGRVRHFENKHLRQVSIRLRTSWNTEQDLLVDAV